MSLRATNARIAKPIRSIHTLVLAVGGAVVFTISLGLACLKFLQRSLSCLSSRVYLQTRLELDDGLLDLARTTQRESKREVQVCIVRCGLDCGSIGIDRALQITLGLEQLAAANAGKGEVRPLDADLLVFSEGLGHLAQGCQRRGYAHAAVAILRVSTNQPLVQHQRLVSLPGLQQGLGLGAVG